ASLFAVGHSFTAVFGFRQTTGSASINYQPRLGAYTGAGNLTTASTTPIQIQIFCTVTSTNNQFCTTAGGVTGSAIVASSQQNFAPTETTGATSSISIVFTVANTSAVTPQFELITAQ